MGPFLGSGLIGDLTTFSAAGYVVSWMLTAFCLIKLRRSEPGLKRPYTIPGGAKTAWFAGLCMAVLLVLLLSPGSRMDRQAGNGVVPLLDGHRRSAVCA